MNGIHLTPGRQLPAQRDHVSMGPQTNRHAGCPSSPSQSLVWGRMAPVAAGCGLRPSQAWGLGLCERESQHSIQFEVSWDLPPFLACLSPSDAELEHPAPPPSQRLLFPGLPTGPIKLRGNKIKDSLGLGTIGRHRERPPDCTAGCSEGRGRLRRAGGNQMGPNSAASEAWNNHD